MPAAEQEVTAPLAAGTRVAADPSLRRRDHGRLLIGGSPLRFLRVTDAGARAVSGWLAGEAVGGGSGTTTLARRLIAAGMVHPIPGSEPGPDLTVVIPVHNDPNGLARTLAAVGGRYPVVVVDDGSDQPVEFDGPATNETAPHRCTLVRREVAGGPGVARAEGLALVTTPLVAFVDAGVGLDGSGDQLDRLARWFNDPDIVAVGPRVACSPGEDVVSRYDERFSPLDLGSVPSRVDLDAPVTYLPTACLVARLRTVQEIGGFDPALRWGEDVDLVWRLGRLGSIRYDPSVVVDHPARPTLNAFVRQRVGYGSSAGPLGKRHGDRLAPVRMSGWSLACWALAFTGRPGLGAGLAAGTAVALERKLRPVLPDSGVEAALLSARGHWYAGRSLASAATRAWWPLTALAGLLGFRSTVGRIAALSLLDRWWSTSGSISERVTHVAMGIVDDAAYGTGVWLGAARHRSPDPLLPKLTEWPPDDDG